MSLSSSFCVFSWAIYHHIGWHSLTGNTPFLSSYLQVFSLSFIFILMMMYLGVDFFGFIQIFFGVHPDI